MTWAENLKPQANPSLPVTLQGSEDSQPTSPSLQFSLAICFHTTLGYLIGLTNSRVQGRKPNQIITHGFKVENLTKSISQSHLWRSLSLARWFPSNFWPREEALKGLCKIPKGEKGLPSSLPLVVFSQVAASTWLLPLATCNMHSPGCPKLSLEWSKHRQQDTTFSAVWAPPKGTSFP